jgi:hypothetical protein
MLKTCRRQARPAAAEPTLQPPRFASKAQVEGGQIVKTLLSGTAAAIILAAALPAWSQGVTTQGQPTRQNTVLPSGKTVPEATRAHPSGDQSGVQGLPGSKSGSTVTPSGAGR